MISLTRCSMVFWSAIFRKVTEAGKQTESSHRHPAVNGKNLPRDITRLFRAKIRGHVGDVGGLAEPFERNDLENLRGRLRVVHELRRHVGFDKTGSDGVDGDAPAREFACEGL